MKKINNKGFTLIELLAVIVILAIIMVIAVPQILNVIDSSRKSAWESNVKLIGEAIELNNALAGTNGTSNFNYSTVCTTAANSLNKDITDSMKNIVDISSTDTTISCPGSVEAVSRGELIVTPTANGQFDGQNSYTITCSSSSCSIAENAS